MGQPVLTTTFSYQGSLKAAGVPANGNFDFEFKLFNALTGGAQVGPAQMGEKVKVDNSLFVVNLDFGEVFTGEMRYLEIAVRPNGSTGAYTTLSPRQTISPVPYALWARNSGGGGTTTEKTELWRFSGINCELEVNGQYRGCNTAGCSKNMTSSFRSFGAYPFGKNIKSVNFLLTKRTIPSGNLSATLQIRNFLGDEIKNLSTIDINSIDLHTWTSFPIPNNTVISNSQQLGFYFFWDSNAIGDFDMASVIFDAAAEVF